jgi:hypothetical protein
MGSAQQSQGPYQVQLHVLLNGRPTSLPTEVFVKSDGRSIILPVVAGNIIVPNEFGTRSNLMIQARIGSDIIRIPNMPSSGLRTSWTIILADKMFDEEYQYMLPKKADNHSACFVLFEPKDAEDWVLPVPNCRKTLRKQQTQ